MAGKYTKKVPIVRAQVAGIPLVKAHGQNFLQDLQYLERSLAGFTLAGANVLEIGPGSGVLTKRLLAEAVARVVAVEIDERWVAYGKKNIKDQRCTIVHGDIAQLDWSTLLGNDTWLLIANLPYHVTFPILFKLVQYRAAIPQALLMVQEEVAQKLVKTGGRDYGYISLFFQWHFSIQLLEKVPPEAFNPPPKVFSRFIALTAQFPAPIVAQEEFWLFIKRCFGQPRRTLENNLKPFHYDLSLIDERYRLLRAQQLRMSDFLAIWRCLIGE